MYYISVKVLRCLPLIHVLCLFSFVDKCVFIRVGEVRMQDGGFHFREWSYDEVISFIIS